MFGLFKKKKITKIDTPKTFLKCVMKLVDLEIPVPLTEKYEIAYRDQKNTLRNGKRRKNKAWYTSQGEHWEGWLYWYKGPGAYNRKNHHRTAEFVYNHIMCPPMFIWLAETAGIKKEIVEKAINQSLESDKYQIQGKIIRTHIPWSDIEKAILKRIEKK